MFIEEAANKSQNGQRDEISQAGCNGCGNVVRVDPQLSCTDHHTDHQHSCREQMEEIQSTGNPDPEVALRTGDRWYGMRKW